MSVIELTKENFTAEVLESKDLVLIDFWAPWCTPCRMFSPVVDQIADEVRGKVKVGKVNVDEQPELAEKFEVRSIPMLVVMKDGKAVQTSTGVLDKKEVLAMLRV